jgi:HAMP domain-containing protein
MNELRELAGYTVLRVRYLIAWRRTERIVRKLERLNREILQMQDEINERR